MSEFKKVSRFEDRYEINEFGELYTNYGSRKKMKCYRNWQGYLMCELKFKLTRNYILIHRLVAEIFIPNPENKPCVIFKNGNIYDIRIDNLQWATKEEVRLHNYDTLRILNIQNSTHCFKNGLLQKTKLFA